jgi:hyperosmotically inducible protein
MHRLNINSFATSAAVAIGLVTMSAFAQAPDNTKVNKMDRSKSEPTADQAKNTPSDREIMQKIRKAVMADKSLSTYAHNVKIISEHGKVTLKGPVHTEEERKSIAAKAVDVAGQDSVTNEITVKGDK